MNQSINHIRKLSLLLGCLFVLGTLKVSSQAFEVNSCITECHQDQVNKNFVHGPTAVDCLSCHESNGQEHPLENVAGFSLVTQGKELCFGCHTEDTEDFSMKYKHKPLKNGDCASCHDPHTSDVASMVSGTAPNMCFQCHDDMNKGRMAENASVHKPSFEEGACSECHVPHSSKIRRLLSKNSKELCLDCHDKRIKREDETIIENVAKHLEENEFIHKALNKRCTSCHNAHYASRPLMLKENFPLESYAKGVEESFMLCFDCHDPDLLNLEKTDSYTMFREGDRNLHYVHVNKEKGRNCSLCHDVHAAKNPQLIATTVKFGRWKMPLNYIATDDGGTCATGCHKELSYSRTITE